MQRKAHRHFNSIVVTLLAVTAALVVAAPSRVKACGGLFCSAANPVNQAAEQIIFSKNSDGTVTAVIQIMYEGPSQSFGWVLPVPGVPTVAVSSDQAFTALKQATNPQYRLQTMFDKGCAQPLATKSAATGATAPGAAEAGNPGVTVQASGAIGPYDYDVISVDPKLSDPAQTAVDWLMAHKYDVGPMGDVVLRPYLKDGLNLIAFKLSKSSNTGSIRPVMLTYSSALPSIPIRPTAVAANDDMGVLVWVLSSARAIPENYKALELNEALIDWFMPNNNYNKVVSKAADEAMGQGFVTEYAQKTSALKTMGVSIWPDFQQQMWTQFSSASHTDAVAMIRDANADWGSYDGFDDALTAAVTLPSSIALMDFKNCVQCYLTAPGVSFDTSKFLTKLYEMVIKPMADTQALLDSLPYITRLYTTLSAAEMTLDPAFDFNPDIKDVSNIHTANRIIECTSGSGNPSTGPWRVELAQGDVVRGTGTTWPVKITDAPAALKILEYGKQGEGKVVMDLTNMVTAMLKKNAGTTTASGTAGSKGGTAGAGTVGTGPGTGATGGGGSGASSSADGGVVGSSKKSGGGCAVADTQPTGSLSLLLFSLAALFVRRKR